MTHNDFDFYEDLIRPLMKFLIQMNILSDHHEDGSDLDGLDSDTSDENLTQKLDNLKETRKPTVSKLVK